MGESPGSLGDILFVIAQNCITLAIRLPHGAVALAW